MNDWIIEGYLSLMQVLSQSEVLFTEFYHKTPSFSHSPLIYQIGL